MEANQNKDLGDKKFNNQQEENAEQEINEGFSGQNIPGDYNPSEKTSQNKTETDQHGKENGVERSQYVNSSAAENASQNGADDNTVIENKKSLENRDHNYDVDATRYKDSHDKNPQNRGNIEMDNE